MAAAVTKTITANQDPIREGATVRERQSIITIPDMTRMSVSVKIHESYIKKIKKGQKARITVDAFPDSVLDGEVTKVGVLPGFPESLYEPGSEGLQHGHHHQTAPMIGSSRA